MRWEDWPPSDPALDPAFAAWRGGQLDEAHRLFDAAVARSPGDADAWRGRGNVAWTQQRFAAALADYQHCVRLQPWNPMHWANVGLAFRDLGQLARAEAMLGAAIALDPGYAPALNELANVLVDGGRYRAALPLYDAALAIDGQRAVVYHNKGVCLRLLGETSAAVALFRAALARDPGYAYSLIELARLVPATDLPPTG